MREYHNQESILQGRNYFDRNPQNARPSKNEEDVVLLLYLQCMQLDMPPKFNQKILTAILLIPIKKKRVKGYRFFFGRE